MRNFYVSVFCEQSGSCEFSSSGSVYECRITQYVNVLTNQMFKPVLKWRNFFIAQLHIKCTVVKHLFSRHTSLYSSAGL